MDDTDKALEALRVQIKKEIIDNYFAGRVDLEEEIGLLHEEVEEYQKKFSQVAQGFCALYQALGSEPAIAAFMRILSLKDWPFYGEFCGLPPVERQRLLMGKRARGLTAFRRYRNVIFDLYEELVRQTEPLHTEYSKIINNLRLINEDIQKFNSSFDFGLIAAQIEAMDGGGEVISGGLLSSEREELSTRMRFKRQKLTEEELPPLPQLPPLKQIKDRLAQELAHLFISP